MSYLNLLNDPDIQIQRWEYIHRNRPKKPVTQSEATAFVKSIEVFQDSPVAIKAVFGDVEVGNEAAAQPPPVDVTVLYKAIIARYKEQNVVAIDEDATLSPQAKAFAKRFYDALEIKIGLPWLKLDLKKFLDSK